MNGDEPGTELLVPPTDQPRALIDVDRAVDEWELYIELTKRLLDRSDYQKIGDTKFKKKSAWRKYAKAFNISAEIIKEEIERGPDGYPIFARVWVRAEEPSGRYQVADQECHTMEKCCGMARGKGCTKSHKHCVPDCDGRIHFSHPGDITATAVTRAKNRAISDLIGAGEVSYEEAEGGRAAGDRPPRTARAPEASEPAHDAPGPPAEAKPPKKAAKAKPITERVAFDKWCAEKNLTKAGQAEKYLGLTMAGDDPIQAEWIEPMAAAGITIDEALDEAKSAIEAVLKEARSLQSQGENNTVPKAVDTIAPLSLRDRAIAARTAEAPGAEAQAQGEGG